MGKTKKELKDDIKILKHNNQVKEKIYNKQYTNYKKLLEEAQTDILNQLKECIHWDGTKSTRKAVLEVRDILEKYGIEE